MSRTLRTESHGDLDGSGFIGPLVGTVRIGEYEINTEEFLDM